VTSITYHAESAVAEIEAAVFSFGVIALVR